MVGFALILLAVLNNVLIFQITQSRQLASSGVLAAKPGIDEIRKQRLLAALTKQLELRVYLDEEVNLNLFAAILNWTARELSAVVNAEFDKGVSAFLNDYKVQHAENLLQCADSQMNVTAIMCESGFRTKSSFKTSSKFEWVVHLLIICKTAQVTDNKYHALLTFNVANSFQLTAFPLGMLAGKLLFRSRFFRLSLVV